MYETTILKTNDLEHWLFFIYLKLSSTQKQALPVFYEHFESKCQCFTYKKEYVGRKSSKSSDNFPIFFSDNKNVYQNLISAVYQLVSDIIIVEESVYNDYLILNILVSSIVIEVIRTVFIFILLWKNFKHLKHKQKYLSNIKPNISISKKASK